MRKSLPLIAGAITIPLLAAVAALAAEGGGTQSPPSTLQTSTGTPSTVATPTLEAPVELATPPQRTLQDAVPQAPVVQLADDPETPPTSTSTTPAPAVPAPPNWDTPAPTPEPVATSTPAPRPIEIVTSWDGITCAMAESWVAETRLGRQTMCPGSGTP